MSLPKPTPLNKKKEKNMIPEDVDIGGIFDLGEMVTEADVIISMTGAN